jgi:hypothetical protein
MYEIQGIGACDCDQSSKPAQSPIILHTIQVVGKWQGSLI